VWSIVGDNGGMGCPGERWRTVARLEEIDLVTNLVKRNLIVTSR
jgi:hypothetical protein